MRNLVIVPAGDHSLHPHFARHRDFDLWVLYWGDDAKVEAAYAETADKLIKLKGYKWELLRKATPQLLSAADRWQDGRILFVDDDILFENGSRDISDFFRIAEEIGSDTAQPAISNDNYSWPLTRKIDGCFCHATNVVEAMMPAYSHEIFYKVVLPGLYALPHVRFGWCFEYFVQRFSEIILRRAVRTFVIDAIPVIHTRPPGTGSSPQSLGWNEAFLYPGLNRFEQCIFEKFENSAEAAQYSFQAGQDYFRDLANEMKVVGDARYFAAKRQTASKPGRLLVFALRNMFRKIFKRQ